MPTPSITVTRFRQERQPAETPDARTVVHIVTPDDAIRFSLRRAVMRAGLGAEVHTDLQEYRHRNGAPHVGCLLIDAAVFGLVSLIKDIHYPIIVTASSSEIMIAVSAMKAGALDVLEKPPCEQRLLRSVAEAIEIDRRRHLEAANLSLVRARFATLTPREREVMALVTSGKLNKLIAADLGLSEITIKAHRGAVMRKMAARSLAELVRMADALFCGSGTQIDPLRTGNLPKARISAGEDRHNGCSLVPG